MFGHGRLTNFQHHRRSDPGMGERSMRFITFVAELE
jgi:hypothetical protein